MSDKQSELGFRFLQPVLIAFFSLLYLNHLRLFFAMDSVPLSHFIFFPIRTMDHILHFSDSLDVLRFFRVDGRLWGYNPYYDAGFPSGISANLDVHWSFIWQAAGLLFSNPVFIFNLSVLLAHLLLPVFILAASRRYKIGKFGELFCYIWCLVVLISIGMAMRLKWTGYYGLLLGLSMSFYGGSLFRSYLLTRKRTDLMAFAFWGGFALFIHPLSGVILFCLSVPALFSFRSGLTFKDWIQLLLCCLFILVLNLAGIIPFFQFWEWKEAGGVFYRTTFDMPKLGWKDLLILAGSLIIFFKALRSLWEKGQKQTAGEQGAVFALLAFSSWLGVRLGLPVTHSACLMVALMIWTAFPLSVVIQREIPRRKIQVLLGLLLIVLSVFLIKNKGPHLTYGYTEQTVSKITRFIRHHTDHQSRIYVQRVNPADYFRSQFAAYLPYATGREFVVGRVGAPGGKEPFLPLMRPSFFETDLEPSAEKTFLERIQLYNIRDFIVRSQNANIFFGQHKAFKRMFQLGPFSIFRYLDAEQNFCYQCSADVAADYDRITVRNAASAVTTLKYHYVDTFRIEPESLTLRPVHVLGDPVPFIQVENGSVHDFVISNGLPGKKKKGPTEKLEKVQSDKPAP